MVKNVWWFLVVDVLVGVVVLICTYFGHRVQESIVVCSCPYLCQDLCLLVLWFCSMSARVLAILIYPHGMQLLLCQLIQLKT